MRKLILAATLILVGCDTPSEPDDRWAVPEKITFAASLDIDLAQMNRTESGLYWQDITVGDLESLPANLDDEVSYHLTIWLPDGRNVHTTRDSGAEMQPILLLIPGLAEGILGMRVGGVRKLVIPPELAWMNGKAPDIPPITTIVCEVELLAIH